MGGRKSQNGVGGAEGLPLAPASASFQHHLNGPISSDIQGRWGWGYQLAVSLFLEMGKGHHCSKLPDLSRLILLGKEVKIHSGSYKGLWSMFYMKQVSSGKWMTGNEGHHRSSSHLRARTVGLLEAAAGVRAPSLVLWNAALDAEERTY